MTNAEKFAAMLEAVAEDLKKYAKELREEGFAAEFTGSTYASEAQGAVYTQMTKDKLL